MNVKKILMGALAVSVVALGARSAQATNALVSATAATCSDKLQNETLKFTGAIQKLIRLSIKNNTGGKDSVCSGGFACGGGVNNGKACTANTDCGPNAVYSDPQCSVNPKKGITASFLKAKAGLRSKVDAACSDTDITNLGFPNSRCPNGINTDKVLDCILGGAVGDFAGSTGIVDSTVGAIMGRAAGTKVPDGIPAFTLGTTQTCAISLGSVLAVGWSNGNPPSNAEGGGATPQVITTATMTAGEYNTEGLGEVGNLLAVTSNPGSLPTCLVTSTTGAGMLGDKTGIGTIDLSGPNPGKQTSEAPIQSVVIVGNLCPKCNAGTGLCDPGSPNAGKACNNRGTDDPICLPTINGTEPVLPNPLNITTESVSIDAPTSGLSGGNAANAMCGSCDGLGSIVGCNSDQDCIDAGFATCTMSTHKGAFGDNTVTTVRSTGKRGPYLPILAGTFCTGKTSTGLDNIVGLPGPVRISNLQLNAFNFTP